MKRLARKLWRNGILLLLCMVMLISESTVVGATEEKVYDSKEELFSAMRQALLPRQKVDLRFEMTDALKEEICYFDNIYNQYFLKSDALVIFDFYGDQSDIPAKEGDYLQQSYYGFSSMGNISGNSIDLKVSNYMTTAEEEQEFETKLNSLFATGGALAEAKNLKDAEKVIACMDYINKNVKGISSYRPADHTGYAALCKGEATCQGIALLFYRLLREVGLPNRILMGTDAAAHTYNIVLIDGKYYYCDASANVVLKGSNNFKPATLQDHYQTEEFKSSVLSKISKTDYPIHSHKYSSKYTSNKTHHWYACSCGEIKDKEAHVAGDWVIDKEATVDKTGSKSKKCIKCGYVMETQTIERIPRVEYQVLEGADSIYRGDADSISLRIEGDKDKFVAVQMDGAIVDSKYYTVRSGSTIVTFTQGYMETLSAGNHTITIQFTDGYANANISVEDNKLPETEKPTESTEEPTEVPTEELTEETTEEPTEEPTEVLTENPTEPTEPIESETEMNDAEGNKDGSKIWIWVLVVLAITAGVAVAFIYYRKKGKSSN